MRVWLSCRSLTLLVVGFLCLPVCSTPATAQILTTLYSFQDSSDGGFPSSSLIFDSSGNLYGTTVDFGTSCGSVFELTPLVGGGWQEITLHDFALNGHDGCYPGRGLVMDAKGNLYGTTTYNPGTVFELSPVSGGGWTESILHTFGGSGDGVSPEYPLILDQAGNLYGTTSYGGAKVFGTVFELTPSQSGGWSEKVLLSFTNPLLQGYHPVCSLVFDAAGNLYGTTTGTGGRFSGRVFELQPQADGSWRYKSLFTFPDSNPYPSAGMIFDQAGNLYGATQGNNSTIRGSVFELTPGSNGTWTGKALYSFKGSPDGALPQSQLLFDKSGNLWGTTTGGGETSPTCFDWNGCGTIFRLSPNADGTWTESRFDFGGQKGIWPYAGLVADQQGNFYGTTDAAGPTGYGTVFEFTP